MVEGGSVPNSASSLQESLPNQNSATGYGFIRPSFSYLNANNNMPHGSSQQSSSAPVKQLDSPGSSASVQPLASGVSVNRMPPFPYNILHPNAGFSASTNDKANGTQEMGAVAPVPAHTQSTSQPAGTNPSDSAPHSVSNNLTNTAMWMPQVPAYQVPPGMPRTPFIPGPPAMAPAAPSPSNMRIPPSPTIQHQGVAPYPSPSLPAAPPGQWLQPQQINSFSRPLFSPYSAAGIPGPYSMPSHGMPHLSVALPDVRPPGVSAPAAAVGVPTSSFASGEQSSSGQGELPPGTDSDKHVGSAETKDESVSTERVDAWTAHRTETGVVYYYNALTGESTYEKPSGFKGEADKAIAQPSPVSWEKLAGTDWTLVTTNDGKRYYYNSKTQLSSWQIPSEVTELKKKQEADVLKAQFVTASNTNLVTEKGSTPVHLSSPAATTGGRDAIAFRPSNVSGTSSALDLIKKKLQDSGIPVSTSPGPALSGEGNSDLNGSKPTEPISKGSQDENNKDKHNGNISDSSSDSEDEDRGPTKEECILQFKEMLKERGVAPFSKWEKELPKIVFDPRFKAIPSHSARRAIFEHYVRTRAEEERKEKRAAQKAALEGFKQLLEEAKEDIHHSTDYQTFKMKWGDDPRFRTLDRKEREVLLNERVLPLKRAAQAERAAAISNFKSMLQDRGDITSKSRWSKVKDNLRSDPRYKSVKHEDREKIFNEYVADLKASEVETEKIAKAKQDEEDKLKERERALRKRKEREEQEVERVRLKARRKEAFESYQALLVETIKDPQASWTVSKAKLEKDPQGRAANPHLDKSDLEKLFREHVKSLHERCIVEFKALLSKVITPEAAARETEEGKTVINSWSTAKQLLKNDPRYNKVPRKERETLWHRHAEDIHHKLKSMNDQETADGKNTSSDPVKQQRTYDRR